MNFNDFTKLLTPNPEPTDIATHSLVMALYHNKCAICGQPASEVHHWLIKRARLPKAQFARINVVANCVLLCHNCHSNLGQTVRGIELCAQAVTSIFGADAILNWYNDLADEHSWRKFNELGDVYGWNQCGSAEQ